ncbi:MAG: FmdB family zinc ribbon protein [Candidatus Geothermincolales bacterium]
MPTYEYKCLECEHVFEEFHSASETREECPRCGGRLRRLFHPVGVIFKGSGFYTTDYKKSSDNGGDKGLTPGKLEEGFEMMKDDLRERREKEKKQKKEEASASKSQSKS